MAATALLLAGCLDWEPEHRDNLYVSLADAEPAFVVMTNEYEVELTLDIKQEDGECVALDYVSVTLDGVAGWTFNGGWVEEDDFSGDDCLPPIAKFDLPATGPASFVVTGGDPDEEVRWTMETIVRTEPVTWSGATRLHHPGDTVSISVPSLAAAQVPTIHIYNTDLVLDIATTEITRVGTEARFVIPELPGVTAQTTATLGVQAAVAPTVVSCDAPKGCTAAASQQTMSSDIKLAP